MLKLRAMYVACAFSKMKPLESRFPNCVGVFQPYYKGTSLNLYFFFPTLNSPHVQLLAIPFLIQVFLPSGYNDATFHNRRTRHRPRASHWSGLWRVHTYTDISFKSLDTNDKKALTQRKLDRRQFESCLERVQRREEKPSSS